METITPYSASTESKKSQVAKMFDNIAFRYDLLNQVLSAGTHHSWRKKAVKEFQHLQPKKILDIATGTGDFAILSVVKPTVRNATFGSEIIGQHAYAVGADFIFNIL